MKWIKVGSWLMSASVALFILENIHFGWNKLPQSRTEEVVDYIVVIIFWIGLFIYLGPLIRLYEKRIKESDKE
jgi:hypothetical protein